MSKELTIIKPDDFHNHLRQGELMPHLVRETAKCFARTNVMPNLVPPIVTPEDVRRYHQELKDVGTELEFLMTFKVMPGSDPNLVPEFRSAGATAAKLYPQGVSTNSEDGVTDIQQLYPLFQAMQEEEMLLLIHGEVPGVDDMKAEEAFLQTLKDVNANFPDLRIVLEHVSSKAAVECLADLSEKVAATVSVQHLTLTIDDVRTHEHINPHHYCRPICKNEGDRKALQEVVFEGNPRYFFGSDSAPHLREAKEVVGKEPARGVYSTPVALQILAELLENNGKLDNLEPFMSHFGSDFYKIPRNTQKITLQKQSWTVPAEYQGVVPIMAGKELSWCISE